MANNQITGRVINISNSVQIPSKNNGNPLTKREFLLDATPYDPYTGERSQYDNILPLELIGDKCSELDHVNINDVVTVSFALQGREWTTQEGQLRRMVSVRCYKVEPRQGGQRTQPAPAYASAAPPQAAASPWQQPAPQPAPAQQPVHPDDLPF